MKQPNSNIATLQETVVEKDLGIWITNDLKQHDHVVCAVKRVNQIFGLIKRTFIYLDCQLLFSCSHHWFDHTWNMVMLYGVHITKRILI